MTAKIRKITVTVEALASNLRDVLARSQPVDLTLVP